MKHLRKIFKENLQIFFSEIKLDHHVSLQHKKGRLVNSDFPAVIVKFIFHGIILRADKKRDESGWISQTSAAQVFSGTRASGLFLDGMNLRPCALEPLLSPLLCVFVLAAHT